MRPKPSPLIGVTRPSQKALHESLMWVTSLKRTLVGAALLSAIIFMIIKAGR